MEKNFERRAAVKFCCKVGFTAAKTWEMFVKVFGDSSVLRVTVFLWHSRFAAGEESIGDRVKRKAENNENEQKHYSGGNCVEGRLPS